MLTIMTARAFSFDPCKPATRVLFALAATGALLIATGCKEVSEPASKSAKESEAMPQVQASPAPRNTSYVIEGEADPDRMALEMKTWTWIKTSYNDDTVKQPTQKEAFTLSFEDGTVRGTSDCNRFSGAYTADKHRIEFAGEMATTRMFCAESQEGEFVEMLANVTSYLFTSRGQLILELAYDSGGMEFR